MWSSAASAAWETAGAKSKGKDLHHGIHGTHGKEGRKRAGREPEKRLLIDLEQNCLQYYPLDFHHRMMTEIDEESKFEPR